MNPKKTKYYPSISKKLKKRNRRFCSLMTPMLSHIFLKTEKSVTKA